MPVTVVPINHMDMVSNNSINGNRLCIPMFYQKLWFNSCKINHLVFWKNMIRCLTAKSLAFGQ